MYKFYFKRLFDILFAILFSPIWFFVFLLVTIFLLTINHRPVYYFGNRIGQFNKEFKIWKFRTLKVKTGKELKGDTVSENDNRLTKVGRYLRKYKIDEIPQFFQVLSGKMSIVGPRPELPVYVDKIFYKKMNISSLKPGLTDYSTILFINLQKKIPNKNTNMYVEKNILDKKNNLKKKYARDISLKTDIHIILETIRKLCSSI
ncbi:sugar transferase [Candidatus Pelagibacter ubique]|nr:sugar transferase [Candidatus Pelagibacter ubique]